ncbi:hypothetical protein SAMN05421810_108206 [Amycolatopsis arida]|uniref:Uncharacterized protein n=1 Tax=Amycolatopsis arida TaxID=587909 RepID=A0A1I5Z3Y2_9PSEU|nr:B-4DMT family transporter [Amycolatopsis arida]TDX90117.1 hypothetical protein CLV69_108206 [Amycolatopsis arida]SFQ51168.1 hypothetical protein SAMN05421810_108206 [Amycolatopsis arida]
MPSWLTRALGMAVLHAAAAVALAKIEAFRPGDLTVLTVILIAVLVGAAALWSALDAWLGVPDRGRAWFVGALVAGPLSGLLTVVGKAVLVDQTGLAALGPALTGGAAFTALLVLIPAGLGLAVGGKLAGDADTESAGDGDRDADGTAQRPSRTTPAG